jgi:hypothetical protein
VDVHQDAGADLPQVVPADLVDGPGARAVYDGQQEGHQQCNDADYDQQLDEREGAAA